MRCPATRLTTVLICAFAAAVGGGCGTLSRSLRAEERGADRALEIRPGSRSRADGAPVAPAPFAASAGHVDTVMAPDVDPSAPDIELVAEDLGPIAQDAGSTGRDVSVMAQARDSDTPPDETDMTEAPEYDPWEKFNEKMFEFNRRLDRYVLKPVAKVYNQIMPEPFQIAISHGFDNIAFVPRMVNSALQGKWGGAGRELSRFLINSTAGLGGLFDPAKDYWGIQKSREDFGQTLGVWGAGPGPYVIVPFLEPLTVRDGIGKFVDLWIDPAAYFLPLLWTRLGLKVGDTVNDRSLNLELFQGFEESVIDLYSAVRHGYLQRRENLIKE